MGETRIKSNNSYDKSSYRAIFDTEEYEEKLRVYIKSNLQVYSVVLAGEARLDREEFCAARFSFSVLKDGKVSFNQGDAVSVKYDGEIIFYGYVFSKSRDKNEIINVVAYDQMRYLKNKRSYTRGNMRLDEIVRKIASDNALTLGDIDKTSAVLPSVAADNVSLLDVIVKACKDTRKLSGEKCILYDSGGYLNLKNEDSLNAGVMIDSSQTENYVYTDTIDNNVYNMISLYNDTKKLNLREIVTVSDKESMEKWGTLILSKKATDITNAYSEAENLLAEYNRVQREIILRGITGNVLYAPGVSLYVKMAMGDLNIDGYVRCKKAVHIFGKNLYTADLYIDGSDWG